MTLTNLIKNTFLVGLAILLYGCVPEMTPRKSTPQLPANYADQSDTLNASNTVWRDYFQDPNLIMLIDTALRYNQELNISIQEIEIARNEVQARKGEYLPFVNAGAGAGFDKVGRYTRSGALEDNLEIRDGQEFPEPLPDFMLGVYASWELDIWRKLRTAKKSALMRYIGTQEARNFMVTNLIAEIANSYYELLALDNQLDIVRRNIEIQTNALEVVKLQKQSTRVTELAVRRFEAQVYNTQSLQFEIQQQIIEVENRINFILGRFPQPIQRNVAYFERAVPDSIKTGIPSQLLANRADIRQAEKELAAAELDIQVARANFYPSIGLRAGVGFQAFNPKYLISPESLMYSLAGDIVSPLVNRNAIKAMYSTANATQIQAAYNYEQTILNAYIEVANQVTRISNLQNSYDFKSRQVQALEESIDISNNLFRSARADYMEVLLTQRDALESRFELIETKMEQFQARINIYRALGGGWR